MDDAQRPAGVAAPAGSRDGPGLEARGLTKRFGSTLAVDDLSFTVPPGEILALLGPNGAGKTTTLTALAGLIRLDAGEVRWQGAPLGPRRGRHVSLIPETPEVYDMLTVWEHMAFVGRICRLAPGWEDEASALLDRLGLATRRDTLGEALSKGLKQRLLVASTMLAGTPVLLLDEPMIGLDPMGQRELRDVIRQLRDEGRVIIVSTHQLDNAQSICDQLVIIKEGRLALAGNIRELLDQHGGSLESVFFEITQ
jgi:ABC-type multidrug transport system ATPase subunit